MYPPPFYPGFFWQETLALGLSHMLCKSVSEGYSFSSGLQWFLRGDSVGEILGNLLSLGLGSWRDLAWLEAGVENSSGLPCGTGTLNSCHWNAREEAASPVWTESGAPVSLEALPNSYRSVHCSVALIRRPRARVWYVNIEL